MSVPTSSALGELLSEINQKLLRWEAEIERTKKPRTYYIAELGNNGMAALLYHSAALQISRFAAYLLRNSLTNRRDGMLFGLTKRPMIESFTRALWLEFIADDERAKHIMKRDMGDVNILSGAGSFPFLNQMWGDLKEASVLEETIDWLQKNKTWWNDAAHIGPNALYMGWSNEYADKFNTNQRIARDLHTLLEIGSQCAGRFYVLHNNGIDTGKTTFIHQEGEQLRAKVTSLA